MSAASKGLRKLLTAQIVQLIASVAIIASKVALEAGSNTLCIAFGLTSGILIILGTLMEVSALKTAAPAEKGYKIAWVLTLGALIASIAGLLATVVLHLKLENDLLYRIVEVFVAFCVIDSTVKLLEKGGHSETAAFGNRLKLIVASGYLVSSVMDFITGTVSAGPSVFLVVLSVVSEVIGFLAVLFFLVFLKKSWNKV